MKHFAYKLQTITGRGRTLRRQCTPAVLSCEPVPVSRVTVWRWRAFNRSAWLRACAEWSDQLAAEVAAAEIAAEATERD